ncbi:hypothetical protein [Prochlorococcus marinus]|nr:hypothetical protein [Prochlorococcus marinus]
MATSLAELNNGPKQSISTQPEGWNYQLSVPGFTAASPHLGIPATLLF